MSIRKRYEELLNNLRNQNLLPSEFRKALKEARNGNYLVKIGRNNKLNYCGQDQMYVDYTYLENGYYVLSKRDDAQWFTALEASEFCRRNHGFCVVLRKKQI